MTSAALRTLGVVGAGQMGRGIAEVAARSGFDVLLHDQDAGATAAALASIESGLRRLVEKGTLAEPAVREALQRIRRVATLDALAPVDFVVEAVVEDLEAKRRLLASLDRICRADVVLASNTSSLSITRLAAATRRPAQVIGMHFMNPVPRMELVEIVAGQATAAAVVETTRDLARRLGKTPVTSQDFPGFISNRILMPMINEAIYALYEGIGTRDDIDAVMRLGMRHPMGPLALADFIGLDTCLAILEILHDGFGDPKYRPCPLLRRMVDAGHLGRKSGRGFYDHPPAGSGA